MEKQLPITQTDKLKAFRQVVCQDCHYLQCFDVHGQQVFMLAKPAPSA
ncbi:hypothetical protein IQ264_14215 [Phormidium sp. LEGE 05292]|nr:hypothetical protein [Phormidium sp. LEGE 05292]MBE9226579.1 hypothetical protein [Phormidium sp. LEGE 05292]